MSTHLGLTPSQAFASGVDILHSLRSDRVLEKVIEAVWRASPLARRLITTMGPIVVFSYTVYDILGRVQSINQLTNHLHSRFVGKITIPGDHPFHDQIFTFVMAQQTPGVDDCSLILRQNSSEPSYVPAIGASVFKWEGHSLKLERHEPTKIQAGNQTQTRPGGFTISCFSFNGGINVVKQFLAHVSEINKSKLQGEAKTKVLRLSKPLNYDPEALWETQPLLRPVRTMETVTMEEKVKRSLLDDVSAYLSPEQKEWYKQRGVPYRRGYMLYGPPGTGKTSTATALAGHFDLPLCLLSLTNSMLNDTKLEELFDALPERCLIVLEDVDSAGIGRETKEKKKKKKADDPMGMMGMMSMFRGRQNQKITLSGLLNVIYAPCSHEGRVLVLATNSPDVLDPALVRPGRVDKKVLFGNASREVAEKLFSRFYGSDVSVDVVQAFASKIPEDKLTPTEITNFLLEHRTDHVAAVEEAEEWAKGIIATKDSGRNVRAFAGQIVEGGNAPTAPAVVPAPTSAPSAATKAVIPAAGSEMFTRDALSAMMRSISGADASSDASLTDESSADEIMDLAVGPDDEDSGDEDSEDEDEDEELYG